MPNGPRQPLASAQALARCALGPLGGTEGRGSKSACADLDGPKAQRLWRWAATARGGLGGDMNRWLRILKHRWLDETRRATRL